MIKNRDILIVGLQPWDIEIGSNCKNIALELARFNRVLYVNPPVDRNTRIRHKGTPFLEKRLAINESGNNLVQIGPNIWNFYPPHFIHSINWIPSNLLFGIANRYNNRIVAKDIRGALNKLSFKGFLLFNDSDMFRSFHLGELLRPFLSIYYTRDNLIATPYWSKHGRRFEPRLMKKSRLVAANSAYLAGIARSHNPHSYDIGQGCDLSVFAPDEERRVPPDIKNIAGPIIGYIGALSGQRLNIDLLAELCTRQRQWNFVFVGKTDAAFDASPLQEMPNVYFLGLKEEKELPDYLAQFDVAINPQQINAMTVGNYPRKIDEYLAMGKPVVATETITMGIFKEFTYLGKTAADYALLIERALREDAPGLAEKRIQFAHQHTWQNSVKALYEAIIATVPGFDQEALG